MIRQPITFCEGQEEAQLRDIVGIEDLGDQHLPAASVFKVDVEAESLSTGERVGARNNIKFHQQQPNDLIQRDELKNQQQQHQAGITEYYQPTVYLLSDDDATLETLSEPSFNPTVTMPMETFLPDIHNVLRSSIRRKSDRKSERLRQKNVTLSSNCALCKRELKSKCPSCQIEELHQKLAAKKEELRRVKLSHIREKKSMQSALNRADTRLKVEKQKHFLTKRKLNTEQHRTKKLSVYALVKFFF